MLTTNGSFHLFYILHLIDLKPLSLKVINSNSEESMTHFSNKAELLRIYFIHQYLMKKPSVAMHTRSGPCAQHRTDSESERRENK
jgi:hypothetical protein